MYAQSKLAFARAWALRDGLDEAHRAAIESYVPETLDLAEVLVEVLFEAREGWVLKRALGRVGDQVFVGMLTSQAYWRGLVEELAALRSSRSGGEREAWVAQRVVRQRPVPTPFGERFVTLGAYVLDGRFTGTSPDHPRFPCLARRALRPRLRRRHWLAERSRNMNRIVASRPSPSSRPPAPSAPLRRRSTRGAPTRRRRQRAAPPRRRRGDPGLHLPSTSPWSRYEKLTLLTYLADVPVDATMPEVGGLAVVRQAEEAAARVAAAGVPKGTLWVVDLRGAASVAFGATLSQRLAGRWRP